MALVRLIKKNEEVNKKQKKSDILLKPKTSQITVNDIEKNQVYAKNHLLESKLPYLKILSITYSVMGRDFIDRQSVVEVTNISKNRDLTNTTDDPRLGTIENCKLCSTCEKTNEDCPGHLGMINLPVPIIHPFFRSSTLKVLQCVCNTCNKLLMLEKHIIGSGIIHSKGFTRLAKIAEQSKDGKIPCTNGCPPNPIFKPQKDSLNESRSILCTKKIGKREIPIYISVEKVNSIFNMISEKEASLLGFINTHPKNFIIDFIPVIPLSARPWSIRESEAKDDYITSTYVDILSKIIESHQTSQFELTGSEDKKEDCYERTIYLYDHLIQNSDQTHRRSPSDVCKSISDRIKGKESLIRGNMMGKRADFTGRTVIGPNRSISFGELAPPEAMMKKLTVPEKVTIYNFEYVKNLSQTGKIDYLCPTNGSFAGRKLKYDPTKHVINVGDKIGRHSENGDSVIFNRQPTLHRQSMLGYTCKFQNKLSVGLHLASTKGHNADFDGDEGNIHMIQTVSAQVESKLLMFVGNSIMSSSRPSPVEGLVINGPNGAYLLSSSDVLFSEEEFQIGLDYIYQYTNNDYVENNYKTLNERIDNFTTLNPLSGKALCSVLFPKDFVYNSTSDGGPLKIRNGILTEGRLNKNHVGPETGSIIQSLWKRYGPKTATDFISNASFLFNWYGEFYGFSISLRDITPLEYSSFRKYKVSEIEKLNEKIVSLSELDKNSSDTEKNMRETEIMNMITDTKNIIQKNFFENHVEKNNPLQIMLKSKSKGDDTSVSNSTCSLFQQTVNSKRPLKLSTSGKRWLPTFDVNDNSIYSRGFTMNSYMEGLNPNEFFVQAQASRIGLADTAVGTASIGNMQRKMTKAQQDLIVEYDGTVRNNNNIIFQFTYGIGVSSTSSVYSVNSSGNKIVSFIDIKELSCEVNTGSGFLETDVFSEITDIFNEINSKYGSEKLDKEEVLEEIEEDNFYEDKIEEDFVGEY